MKICFLSILLVPAFFSSCKKTEFKEGIQFKNELDYVLNNIACYNVQIDDFLEYCKAVTLIFEDFRKSFIEKAIPFFDKYLPAEIPKTVFYPFGGNDLFSALATYTGANEIITVSLESAGDVRRFRSLTKSTLQPAIASLKEMIASHLQTHNSSNDNVIASDKNPLAGQIAMSVIAAHLYGYKPISLRFFEFDKEGKIIYLDEKRLKELESQKSKKLQPYWVDPDFSIAFQNMEIVYEKEIPEQARKKSEKKRVTHRHIAENLVDKNFNSSSLKKYLAQKGKIAAMTKAASYLLWFDNFASLRNFLLEHMTIMVSDATGILPHHFLLADFIGQTFGKFTGAFLPQDGGAEAKEMVRFFNSQVFRPLNFHYGHGDIAAHNHLIILRKKTSPY